MDELTNTRPSDIAALDALAIEAQMYAANARLNLFHLARVFDEARALLPDGEWGEWVKANAGVEMRTAQQMLQKYHRFGDRPAFAQISSSKLGKMLSLPEGAEEDFISIYDVDEMSAREVEKAVRAYKTQMQAEIDAERAARQEAERRAEEAANRPTEIPRALQNELEERRAEADRQRAEIDRLSGIGRDSLEERQRLSRENAQLRQELQERDELIQDQQDAVNQAQAELLNLQSAQARGDAERVPTGELTADMFATAVREFMGMCARMPHMQRTFGSMTQAEKSGYDEYLQIIEAWADGARAALASVTVEVEGGFTIV